VPVNEENGKSAPLPTSPLNMLGYDIEFNPKEEDLWGLQIAGL
jgi:hypothetical protein